MNKTYGNSRVNATLEKYDGKLEKLDQPLYMDAYNKTIHEDGIHGCIRCGVDFRNNDFLLIPVDEAQFRQSSNRSNRIH